MEKILKVSFNHLQSELLRILDEDLRSKGIKSFKEMAMHRRKIRDYLRKNQEQILTELLETLKKGTDPRSDEFIHPYAKNVYSRIFPEVSITAKPSAPSPKASVKKKKESEDDLLSLLGGSSEENSEEEDLSSLLSEGSKKEESEPDEDDLLKLLES